MIIKKSFSVFVLEKSLYFLVSGSEEFHINLAVILNVKPCPPDIGGPSG